MTRDDRERNLLRFIEILWREIGKPRQTELKREHPDMRWALPASERIARAPDDVLTTAEVAQELGLKPSAVWNWPRRYGVHPVNGKWRWQDVMLAHLRAEKKRHERTTRKPRHAEESRPCNPAIRQEQ